MKTIKNERFYRNFHYFLRMNYIDMVLICDTMDLLIKTGRLVNLS